VKAAYGAASCHLLKLNSRQPGTSTEDIPDPWSHFISTPMTDKVSDKTSPSYLPDSLPLPMWEEFSSLEFFYRREGIFMSF